jgi:excisionase family DNA binding protein
MAELTPREAAEILGVARNTVRLWAESGRLPCRVTAGGHRRFDERVVRQWADLPRGPAEPADRDVCGWRRCADAMLNAAIKDLGAGTEAAAPFRAALIALRGADSG